LFFSAPPREPIFFSASAPTKTPAEAAAPVFRDSAVLEARWILK
jgi:hypothetical protein